MKKILVLFLSLFLVLPLQAGADKLEVLRYSGKDRYQTCIDASKNSFEEAEYAIVSNGEAYEETLQSAILGVQFKAPLFLTHRDKLPENLLEELQRLEVDYVYIIGGLDKVSKSVEDSIKGLGIYTIRIGKEGIQALSSDVHKEIRSSINSPYAGDWVATYNPDKLVDAMVAAPFVGKGNYGDDKEMVLSFSPNAPHAAYFFGGKTSLPFENLGSIRFGGENRYETAVQVAEGMKKHLDLDSDYIVLVDGTRLPDALSSGPIAGLYDAPYSLRPLEACPRKQGTI